MTQTGTATNPPSLPFEIDEHPAALPELDRLNNEGGQFLPAKGAADQQRQDHVVALALQYRPIGKPAQWPALSSMIGGSINTKIIEQQLGEILRLAASIQQGTVTASLILRKLGSYPRQNSLALALREIGRIERTLFMLAWLEDPALRRRVTAGLNKGDARNSLARAVFFNRLGEIRDRSFENQRHRASGLNFVVAAITLWNTVYLERATEQMARSRQIDPALLQHVSPLGWEHINLTGDYTWHANKRVAKGGFRPLRSPRNPSAPP